MLQISLKAARVNAGLTIKDASRLVKVSEDRLRNFESGRTPIPAHVFQRAARVYGVPEQNLRPPIVDDGEFDEEEKNLLCTTF